jgi:uncharacterized surface protein with fasciclin (FAS1) repeats
MHNLNSSISKNWLTKLACFVGIAGVSTLISFPVLARFYPRYTLFQPSASSNYPYRNSENSIADTLAQDSKFTNLYNELKAAGLLETLKQPGHFTLFAPTNEAFNALPKDVFSRYTKNRIKVLKYHLVSSKITESDVSDKHGKAIVTVEGSPIIITAISEDGVKLNDDTNPKPPSIETKNGVIVEVDKVLLPKGF